MKWVHGGQQNFPHYSFAIGDMNEMSLYDLIWFVGFSGLGYDEDIGYDGFTDLISLISSSCVFII